MTNHRTPCSADSRVACDIEHKHRCDNCGTTWKHQNDLEALTDEEHRVAHTCPQCDVTQYSKHWEAGEISAFLDGNDAAQRKLVKSLIAYLLEGVQA